MVQNQTPAQTSDLIAKAAAKGKFLDFRNNLVAARGNEYAMIHGIGGQQHAPRSTIKMFITDYSVQNNTKTVYANIQPELAAYLLSACENALRCSGTSKAGGMYQEAANAVAQMRRETVLQPGTPVNPSAEPILAVSAELVDKLPNMPMPSAALQLASMLDPIPLPPNGPTVYVGVRKRIVDLLAQALSSAGQASGADFSYSQDRVNPYREENGLCPVSTLSITRSGLRKDGSVSQMPWYVTIKNFRAKPIKQTNGMTSYSGSTIQDQKEAFILVSDLDMYRCTYRVIRFIELWEMAVGIPLIKAGLKQKEIEHANR